jgi:hypothetical protein
MWRCGVIDLPSYAGCHIKLKPLPLADIALFPLLSHVTKAKTILQSLQSLQRDWANSMVQRTPASASVLLVNRKQWRHCLVATRLIDQQVATPIYLSSLLR